MTRIMAVRTFLRSLKKECYICGSKKKLGFHHMNKKEKAFHLGADKTTRLPYEVIIREVEKCIVLCRHCHDLVDSVGEYKKDQLTNGGYNDVA